MLRVTTRIWGNRHSGAQERYLRVTVILRVELGACRKQMTGNSILRHLTLDISHWSELSLEISNSSSPAPSARNAFSQRCHSRCFTYSDNHVSYSANFLYACAIVQCPSQMAFQLWIHLSRVSEATLGTNPIDSHLAVLGPPSVRNYSPQPSRHSCCLKYIHTSILLSTQGPRSQICPIDPSLFLRLCHIACQRRFVPDARSGKMGRRRLPPVLMLGSTLKVRREAKVGWPL